MRRGGRIAMDPAKGGDRRTRHPHEAPFVESSSSGPSRRPRPPRPFRILLGITGSVAAVKGPELVCRLVDALSKKRGSRGFEDNNDDDDDGSDGSSFSSVQVRVILTGGGSNFWSRASEYDPASWARLQDLMNDGVSGPVHEETASEDAAPPIVIYESDREWRDWTRMGDPVLHIELRNWADVLVVAPLSAHTLAKFANGLCDDTLSCVVRAWFSSSTMTTRTTNKPMVVAPAMNTGMWQHPLTSRQLQTLQSFAPHPSLVTVVPPQVKNLACGEVGDGALAPINTIVEAVARFQQRIREGEFDVLLEFDTRGW